MTKPVITPGDIVRAELDAEHNRQSFLLRTYKAGDPRRASVRRVAGVQASRPSDRRRARVPSARPAAPGAVVGAIGLLALLIAGAWLALLGLIWLAIQVLRWVMEIFVWGKF